jgi:7-cyano-7-deazaguanine synthase
MLPSKIRKMPETSNGSSGRAVVLLSGGMDSAVCAALAVRDYETAALHMSYGQRTEARERLAFNRICDRLGIGKRLVLENRTLALIGGSALTDRQIDVPAAGTEIGRQIPITYVPFRNAHFIAAGVSWAEVLGATSIFIGAVAQDSSGYPDCRPEYYEAFNHVIQVGTREGNIQIATPLIGLRKAEIVKLGLELGAPFDLTWSCYSREDRACGACESCVLRLRAFAAAGASDPIPYVIQGAAG